MTSRAHLVQEYVFIDVMSTFLRAIRAGAIDVRHGAVLLAHYGRLGPSFDICVKVVIDVLREEGMINNEGDAVVVVVTQALQEVGISRALSSVSFLILFDNRHTHWYLKRLSRTRPTACNSQNFSRLAS